MPGKYHIFISSAPDDLKNEKNALCRIIFDLGHIPVCMDSVDIAEKNGWRIIKKNIAEADWFVSLIGRQYGALPEEAGVPGSVTEIEYAQAIKLEIPVLALLNTGKPRGRAPKKAADAKKDSGKAENQAALEDFKERLRKHPHAEWNTLNEFRTVSRELLTQEFFLNPRPGWVPGAERVAPAVANALGRLSAENETLRRQLASAQGSEARWQKSMRHTLVLLNNNRASISFYYNNGSGWENPVRCRYLRLFKLLIPELYLGKSTPELSRFIGSILNPDLNRSLRKDFPTPSNTVKKIMADLHSLRLVQYSPGQGEEIWEASDYGRELYSLYRTRQFERPSKPGKETDPKA